MSRSSLFPNFLPRVLLLSCYTRALLSVSFAASGQESYTTQTSFRDRPPLLPVQIGTQLNGAQTRQAI